MGLFDILKPDTVIESTVTGAAIGAYIGDKLDERADREHIIGLLEAQIAQRNYHFALDNLLNTPEQPEGMYDKWFWVWDPPGCCAKYHVSYLYRAIVDQAFSRERSKLYCRWHAVRARALAVGIVPTISMPRTNSGDIAGTPESLRRAMDGIAARVAVRERESKINKKWGA